MLGESKESESSFMSFVTSSSICGAGKFWLKHTEKGNKNKTGFWWELVAEIISLLWRAFVQLLLSVCGRCFCTWRDGKGALLRQIDVDIPVFWKQGERWLS